MRFADRGERGIRLEWFRVRSDHFSDKILTKSEHHDLGLRMPRIGPPPPLLQAIHSGDLAASRGWWRGIRFFYITTRAFLKNVFVNPEHSEPALQVPSLYWPNSEVNTDPPKSSWEENLGMGCVCVVFPSGVCWEGCRSFKFY